MHNYSTPRQHKRYASYSMCIRVVLVNAEICALRERLNHANYLSAPSTFVPMVL